MKTKVLAIPCLAAVLLAASAARADFVYNDFTSVAGLNLVGSATQDIDRIGMTHGVAAERGNVWTQAQQSVGAGFSTSFAFQGTNLGGEDDYNGNIGVWQISFIVQNIGNSISNIAAQDPLYPRLRIHFDGWMDAGSQDPSSSSVWVAYNGSIVQATDVESLGIIFRDQAVHQATINYANQVLEILVDSIPVMTLQGIDLSAGGLGNSYIGFESYCGARAWADNDLLSWSFQSVPEPASLLVLALGGLCLRKRV